MVDTLTRLNLCRAEPGRYHFMSRIKTARSHWGLACTPGPVLDSYADHDKLRYMLGWHNGQSVHILHLVKVSITAQNLM